MKTEYEKKLEAEINRRLNQLPELPAPLALAGRVMAVINSHHQIWYRQPWHQWPLFPRTVLFGLLAGGFAAVYYLLGNLSQNLPPILVTGTHAMVETTRNLAASMLGWFTQIRSAYLIGFTVAMGVSYILIVSLGAALFRIVWATPELRKYETQ